MKLQTALSSSSNKQLVALEVKLRVLTGEVEQLGEHAALAQKLQVGGSILGSQRSSRPAVMCLFK